VPDPRHARARLDVRQSALLQGPEVNSQLGIEKRARREDLGRPRQDRSARAIPLAIVVARRQHLLDDWDGLPRFGLFDLIVATITGLLTTHGGKAGYLDRVTLLFAEMKGRSSEYASLGLLMIAAGNTPMRRGRYLSG
jgi:hypothetical protein